MASPSFDDAEFLVGPCPDCNRDVLTHVDIGPSSELVRHCLHCDAVLAEPSLTLVSGADLEAHGYAVLEARVCGNGGGCSPTGCGSRR
jgi:hypothetical protein